MDIMLRTPYVQLPSTRSSFVHILFINIVLFSPVYSQHTDTVTEESYMTSTHWTDLTMTEMNDKEVYTTSDVVKSTEPLGAIKTEIPTKVTETRTDTGATSETPTRSNAATKVSVIVNNTAGSRINILTHSPSLNPTGIASITVENVTHQSVIVFWELLQNRDEGNYRLVGYELTQKSLRVQAKITDLFVNASSQGMHRLIQENLNHHTIYMFCVLPVIFDTNGTLISSDIADGASVMNSTDCLAFTTPYNPLNPEALIAMILAVFIVIAFLVVLVLGKMCEQSEEKEQEEKRTLVNKLLQRRKRKPDYGSDSLQLLSSYKIIGEDKQELEPIEEPFQSEIIKVFKDEDGKEIEWVDGSDIEFDEDICLNEEDSDSGFLLAPSEM